MKRITLFIVTTIILLGAWFVLDYRQDTQQSNNEILQKIASIQNDLQDTLDKCDNIIVSLKNEDFDELQQLTREKMDLELQVANLKAQLEATSWYKESEEIKSRYGGEKK